MCAPPASIPTQVCVAANPSHLLPQRAGLQSGLKVRPQRCAACGGLLGCAVAAHLLAATFAAVMAAFVAVS